MVIGYPLLERIHYLLVAGFDVYGNVGHQLTTRLYMDFLRMEGEMNFLALLPRAVAPAGARPLVSRRRASTSIELLQDTEAYFAHETGIRYTTGDPLAELYAMMKKRAGAGDRARATRSPRAGCPPRRCAS